MELHKRYVVLREQKDELKKQLSEVQSQLDEAEVELVNWLENNSLTNVKSELGTISLRAEVYARIDDEATAFSWLRENNMGDIIKETVHSKTLASLVKDNGDIPGVVSHYQTKISFRTNNKKGE